MSLAKRGKTPYWTYGQYGFVMVYNDLKNSSAYRCLKPTERLILIDMIRVYSKVSKRGAERVPEGFPYTFPMCMEDVCETSFQRGIRTLMAKGFFSAPPTIQDDRPGSPKYYHQSYEWTKYEPSKEETRKLNEYNYKKKNRQKAKQRRMTNFRAGYKSK